MLPQKELHEIRALLQSAQSPVFFFDDDCDGLCSFLLLQKYCGKGDGVPIKNAPEFTQVYLSKIQELQPDLVVILDKPIVDQVFLDQVHVPVLWMDHHPPVARKKVHYFNPRLHGTGEGYSTTRMAYEVTNQNLWIATVGSVADWTIPPFLKEFDQLYPGIVSTSVTDPGDLLFKHKIGELVKLMYFTLKGTTSEVRKDIKLLLTITNPLELLEGTTDAGKLCQEHTKKNFKEYEVILNKAKAAADPEDPVLVFLYPSTKNSYTGMIANELVYLYPKKVIIVGREKSGDVRMSLRSPRYVLPPILEKALVGLHGYGGGHDHACGASVPKDDFERFLTQLREQL